MKVFIPGGRFFQGIIDKRAPEEAFFGMSAPAGDGYFPSEDKQIMVIRSQDEERRPSPRGSRGDGC
jgi:hypothetical protein